MKWSAEGFVVADTFKNGMACPVNYDWTDSKHNKCVQVIDGNSKWYTDPICPTGKVYAFSNCYTSSQQTKMENMYYGISAGIGFVFALVITFFSRFLKVYFGLL